MTVKTDHVIHTENGKLGGGDRSSLADVKRILDLAVNADSKQGLVIHFHGGLVGGKQGIKMAERLQPLYSEAGAYPFFFVWESGFFETIWNNLQDISHEKFFRELVKKASEWVLKKATVELGAKGAGGRLFDEDEFRDSFDKYFQGIEKLPPVPLENPPLAQPGQAKGAIPTEEGLENEILVSISGDAGFRTAVKEVYNGLKDADTDESATRGIGASGVASNSLISPEAADELFEAKLRNDDMTKGIFTLPKVALFMAKLVIRVIKRLADGRGHGVYCTVIEEVLRSAYGDKVGKVFWGNMKKDTRDTFKNGPEFGGTAFLQGLRALAEKNSKFSRITVVAHSAGAIQACHFLAAAANEIPGVKFDVVFLAPAVSYAVFAATLAEHAGSIANFRCYNMSDKVESDDNLVPILYTRSLLYFVSGLLEDHVDEPLVGMERYLVNGDTYPKKDFPAVHAGSEFLAGKMIWSVTGPGEKDGFLSHSLKHGDFDNDPTTLASVKWILEKGF